MKENKPIYLVGDVHGQFNTLCAMTRMASDCHLICVGDLGIGFTGNHNKQLRQFEYLNDTFKARNIDFLSIRGNHDDPAYWGLGKIHQHIKLSNFELVPDYTLKIINDERWLFVGGGISIDRTARSLGQTYWPLETFYLDESKIVECDVLVTHSGPNWIGPYDKSGIEYWCKRDPKLWDDCKKEREDHNTLYRLAKPKYAYLGHFHRFEAVEFNGCYTTILDELQFVEYKPYGTQKETETV